MGHLRDFQSELDETPSYDSPTTLPHSVASEVWGEGNLVKLLALKEK